MKRTSIEVLRAASLIAVLFLGSIPPGGGTLYAKHKGEQADPDDATSRLFQLLDSARDGKLADYYLLADLYKDPNEPDDEYRHVLRVNYDKSRGFGKLNVWVRRLGKMIARQLEAYTRRQLDGFADADQE